MNFGSRREPATYLPIALKFRQTANGLMLESQSNAEVDDMIWLSLALCLVGCAIAVITFVMNSQTPMQLGPIPFFFGCGLALIGLMLFVKFI